MVGLDLLGVQLGGGELKGERGRYGSWVGFVDIGKEGGLWVEGKPRKEG